MLPNARSNIAFWTNTETIAAETIFAIFNCAVIGALFLNSNYGSDIWSYIGYGFGTGIGFFLACFLLNIAHEKLDSDKIPRIFRGYPIMLVYIGVISLAFYALAGYTVDF